MPTYDTQQPLSPEDQKILDDVLRRYGIRPRSITQTVLRGAATATGAMADGMAQNRANGANNAVLVEEINRRREADYRQHLLEREQEGRVGEDAAYRNSVRADYMTNPNMPASARHTPVRSAGQLSAAAASKATAMKRLEGGNPMPMPTYAPFALDPKLSQPGRGESALGWGSVAATAASAIPSSAWQRALKLFGKIF